MKLSAINLNKYPSFYDQPSADIIKLLLLKSPYISSHASQFTKKKSYMTLECDTLLQLQKWWYVILFILYKLLSTNKSCPLYNKIKAEHHNISKFLLPTDTHPKYSTAKESFESFLRSLRVHLVKYTTISSSKSPKSHVKIVTYMKNENGFDLLIAI